MPAMADSNVASAATALENEINPAISIEFFERAAMDALSHIACQPPEGPWDWDARQYPLPKRGRNVPNLASLNNHSQVLLELIRLVPNASPIHSRLSYMLKRLHRCFNIFSSSGRSKLVRMAISRHAARAATRWCVMCRHCLFLV